MTITHAGILEAVAKVADRVKEVAEECTNRAVCAENGHIDCPHVVDPVTGDRRSTSLRGRHRGRSGATLGEWVEKRQHRRVARYVRRYVKAKQRWQRRGRIAGAVAMAPVRAAFHPLRTLFVVLIVLLMFPALQRPLGPVAHILPGSYSPTACGTSGAPLTATSVAWAAGHGVRALDREPLTREQVIDGLTAAARQVRRTADALLSGLRDQAAPVSTTTAVSASTAGCGSCGDTGGTGTMSASLRTSTPGLAHAQAAVTDGTLTGERLVRFVAEGIVEDGSGNPAAVNPTEVRGSHATGLWQVMMPLHADLFAGKSPTDPVANAHVGALILERQGWGAWDDSHPRAWKAHEGEARAALAAVHGGRAPGAGVVNASCATVPLPGAPGADSTGVVAVARRFLGTPYVWGGEEPGGFDCSGFTSYVWAQMGVTIPRTAEQQRLWATPVSPGQVQVGDLVFFQSRPGAEAHHVGLYVGDGRMIDAPHTGDVVKERAVYGGELITYGRVTGTRGSA